MFKKILLFCVCGCACMPAMADVISADDGDVVITDAARLFDIAGDVCAGISDQISDVSGISKVNTVVTAVGTVAGGGALYVGLKKEDVDKRIEELEQQICDAGGCTPDGIDAMSDADFFDNVIGPIAEIAELQRLTEQSKNLGNWRTGLMAGAAATHITSTIISAMNKDQSDLGQHVLACNAAIAELGAYADKLNRAGVNPYTNPIVMNIRDAIDACDAISIDDVHRIENREKWVMGSSIVGGTAAISGTVTSAMANSDSVRNNNTDAGRAKEKNLNTASNVLAGVSTVGSGVATGFNISLITLTNSMIKKAEQCESVFIQ